jgi:hypothetical protein
MMATYTWSAYVKTDTARPKPLCAGSSGYTPLSGYPPTGKVDVGPRSELNCKMYSDAVTRMKSNIRAIIVVNLTFVFCLPYYSIIIITISKKPDCCIVFIKFNILRPLEVFKIALLL